CMSSAQTYPPSLHDALPIFREDVLTGVVPDVVGAAADVPVPEVATRADLAVLEVRVDDQAVGIALETDVVHLVPRARRTQCDARSEEHTSELQSRENLVCRL